MGYFFSFTLLYTLCAYYIISIIVYFVKKVEKFTLDLKKSCFFVL